MSHSILASTPLPAHLWLTTGSVMLHFLWVGALVGLLSALLRWLIRGADPRLRYLAALSCLALMVGTVPLIALSVRLPPRARAAPDRTTVHSPSAPRGRIVLVPIEWLGPRSSVPKPRQVATAPAMPSRDARVFWFERVALYLEHARHWLPWVWLIGTPLVFLSLACGLVGVERLRRQCEIDPDSPVSLRCQQLARALRISRQVAIGISDRVVSPLLLGILRPTIVLSPTLLAGLTPDQLEMVLLHELAHVRRWDNLINLLQRLVEALLFFQPAVWWVSTWARLEREHCCDALVLAQSARPQAYAETLAGLALHGFAPRQAVAVMANHQLVIRIRHILSLEDRSMKVSRTMLTSLAVMFLAISYLVVTQSSPAGAQNPGETPPAGQATGDSSSGGSSPGGNSATAGKTTPAEVFDPSTGAPTQGESAAQPTGTGSDSGTGSPPAGSPDGTAVHYGDAGLGSDSQRQRVEVLYDQTGSDANYRTSVAWFDTPTRDFGPEQATGAPNTPEGADRRTAWASQTEDGQEEWLELGYDVPVDAVAILIHENVNPGAVTRVTLYDADGNELVGWSGEDPTAAGSERGVSVIPLKVKKLKIQRVKLFINSPAVSGYNEIDAVGLVDHSGTTHWATTASASSSFADTQVPSQYVRFVTGLYDPNSADSQRITHLEEEVRQLRAELEQLKALLNANPPDVANPAAVNINIPALGPNPIAVPNSP